MKTLVSVKKIIWNTLIFLQEKNEIESKVNIGVTKSLQIKYIRSKLLQSSITTNSSFFCFSAVFRDFIEV